MEEETLIKREYSKIKDELEQKSKNIVLYNVFRDGIFSAENSETKELTVILLFKLSS